MLHRHTRYFVRPECMHDVLGHCVALHQCWYGLHGVSAHSISGLWHARLAFGLTAAAVPLAQKMPSCLLHANRHFHQLVVTDSVILMHVTAPYTYLQRLLLLCPKV